MKLKANLLLSLLISCIAIQNNLAQENKQEKVVVTEKEYNTFSSEDAIQTEQVLPKVNLDDQNAEDLIHNVAGLEVSPEYPGGIEKFYSFISKNLVISDEVKANKVKGRVFATFVIERDGKLSNIKILRDLKFGTAQEVLKVLNKSPKWLPGQRNGKIVRCQYSIPITIDGTK